MKAILPRQVELGRITSGTFWSAPNSGPNGAFRIQGPAGKPLTIISSDHGGWEHVSVSLPSRCPNWVEMSFVKDLFWGDDEAVMQFHPPKSSYVNNHKFCLHLWRPVRETIPTPPLVMV